MSQVPACPFGFGGRVVDRNDLSSEERNIARPFVASMTRSVAFAAVVSLTGMSYGLTPRILHTALLCNSIFETKNEMDNGDDACSVIMQTVSGFAGSYGGLFLSLFLASF